MSKDQQLLMEEGHAMTFHQIRRYEARILELERQRNEALYWLVKKTLTDEKSSSGAWEFLVSLGYDLSKNPNPAVQALFDTVEGK